MSEDGWKGMVWIKITTDVFDDEAVKLIDAMPERDTILVIWFKLLCLVGASCGNGVVAFKDRMPYTDEMLSSVFHRPLNTVRLAMDTFANLGMIERTDDTYVIPSWEKYQGSDKLEKRRESDRLRKQRQRERQKLLVEGMSRDSHADVTRTSHPQNKNKNKKEEELHILSSSENSDSELAWLCEEVVSYLNAKIGSHYKPTSQKTKKLINARRKEGFALEDFKTVIDKKSESWLNDPEMSKYLRPETLFGTKFEGYLNEIHATKGYFTSDAPSEGGEGWLNEVDLSDWGML